MKREIFNKYVDYIADISACDKQELFVKSKKRWRVDARHLLYYLCYTRPMRVSDIQDYMQSWGYDISHSSIIHGIKQVCQKVEDDKDYESIVKDIKLILNHV